MKLHAMQRHDTGALRAFLDGELSLSERRAVAAHLAECPACSGELELLRSRAAGTRSRLGELEGSDQLPSTQASLLRFHSSIAASEAASRGGFRENMTRSFEMIKRNALSPRWRPAFVALSAVMIVALLFSIAPVRSAAADFLSLFRIRKFAVIPLNQEQLSKLEQLANQAEGQFGHPQVVREPGAEQAVSDPSQASSLAGFAVRTPARLPDQATLSQFTVQAGPAMHYEVDRAALAAFMQAAGASTDGLPQTDKIVADVDVANMVSQKYTSLRGGSLEFVQVPSPKVNLSEGVNPAALAETGFMFLGMPQEDARRLAASIDWTSTLVVPLPSDAASAREVTVDGATALLLEGHNSGRRDYALAWEKDNVLYFMNSRNVDEKQILDAADSLQ